MLVSFASEKHDNPLVIYRYGFDGLSRMRNGQSRTQAGRKHIPNASKVAPTSFFRLAFKLQIKPWYIPVHVKSTEEFCNLRVPRKLNWDEICSNSYSLILFREPPTRRHRNKRDHFFGKMQLGISDFSNTRYTCIRGFFQLTYRRACVARTNAGKKRPERRARLASCKANIATELLSYKVQRELN